MVTVVTTKELRAGEFLLRYEAKAFEDDIPGISSISASLMFGNCCEKWQILLHVFCCPSDVRYFVQDQQHMCLGSWLSEMETCTIFKMLTHHKYQHRHLNHIMAPKHDISKNGTSDPITSVLGAVPG